MSVVRVEYKYLYRSEKTLALSARAATTNEADDGHDETEYEQDDAYPEEDFRIVFRSEHALVDVRQPQRSQCNNSQARQLLHTHIRENDECTKLQHENYNYLCS